jgi:CHAT domain-containing protein
MQQQNWPDMQKHSEALVKVAESFGERDQRLPLSLNQLAIAHFSQGRYDEAEPLFKRAIVIAEHQPSVGPFHEQPYVTMSLQMLGLIYKMQGRDVDAQLLEKRARAMRDRTGRQIQKQKQVTRPPDVEAWDLMSEANTHVLQGQYAEAETLLRRALGIQEKALGPEHERIVQPLMQLARVYTAQERYRDAEESLKRALAIAERPPSRSTIQVLGKVFPAELAHKKTLAHVLRELAKVYRVLERYGEAEELLKRELAIWEEGRSWAGESSSVNVAAIFAELAAIHSSQGRHAEAEQLRGHATAMAHESANAASYVLMSLVKRAADLVAERRYAEAEPLLRDVLAIQDKIGGFEYSNIVPTLTRLTEVYWSQGRYADALGAARRVMDIFKKRAGMASGKSVGVISERRKDRGLLLEYVKLLSEAVVAIPDQSLQLLAEAFEVGEFSRTSDAASAVARMAARFATGDDELARLVRHRQDALERWQHLDSEFIKMLGRSPGERNAAQERKIRGELASLDREFGRLDVTLGTQFPAYKELTSPLPISVDETQALLASDEALVAYLVGAKESFVWVVRKDNADFRRTEIAQQELNNAVQQLRRALEPFEGMTVQQIRAFPINQSHELYRRILAPIESLLTGVTHVFVVPDGALQSLPFGVLVTEPPKSPVNDLARYRDVAWLAKKYAVTTLPSASSLRALRRFAREAAGSQPFTGFGDPLLEERGGRSRGINIATLFSRGAVADVNELRRLPRLPETADELYAVAKALKANPEHVHLRHAATETNVKRLDLSRYRVLAFATHGLMAGDFGGLAEPALVLTPPEKGTALDDGLLTASEIAQLKLNADWVILSACNTAAADGTPGAEGLSGLAKAFFYAGSRALLVSHWAVSSDATVELTTKMLSEAAASPEIGRSEALRRSMLALMNNGDKVYHAHPMFWGPFTVVGEGGAASAQQAATRVVITRPEAKADEGGNAPMLPSDAGRTEQSNVAKPEVPQAGRPIPPTILPVPAAEIFEGILRGAREVLDGVKKGVTDVLQGRGEKQ